MILNYLLVSISKISKSNLDSICLIISLISIDLYKEPKDIGISKFVLLSNSQHNLPNNRFKKIKQP